MYADFCFPLEPAGRGGAEIRQGVEICIRSAENGYADLPLPIKFYLENVAFDFQPIY
jgi:hypothetical protein